MVGGELFGIKCKKRISKTKKNVPNVVTVNDSNRRFRATGGLSSKR